MKVKIGSSAQAQHRVKSKENVTESGWWVQMKMLL